MQSVTLNETEGYDQDLQTQTWAPAEPEEQEGGGNPLAGVLRAMRGRWMLAGILGLSLGGGLGTLGFLNGTVLYQSQAILRVYPKDSGILYSSDDSVLKTYSTYIKAETSTVASYEVMERATRSLRALFPVLTEEMRIKDLRGSVEIKRSESLIVLTTTSKDPEFAAAKLETITSAYLALKAERQAQQEDLRGSELARRETDLLARLKDINARMLEVGGEYGTTAINKAHIEKIAQIDALAVRRGEVARTLEGMNSEDNSGGSADMNDEMIMRATLLDRALADLNFELARHKATLATLRQRYTEGSAEIQDKLGQIKIIEEAMSARRQQIQILGQTGALTDQNAGGADAEESRDAIQALLTKVTEELAEARAEARELNARRLELAFLEEERAQTREMLDDTRAALDVIRVESRKDSPGFTELMSHAVVPDEPSEDSSKKLALGGGTLGFMLGFMMVLGAGLTSGRLRWSDGLQKLVDDMPVLSVIRDKGRKGRQSRARAIDRLRTTVQLLPARGGPIEQAKAKRGRCISVLRTAPGMSDGQLSGDLARSFARTGMSVLHVNADPAAASDGARGWRDGLSNGGDFEPRQLDNTLWDLPVGGADAEHLVDPSLSALRRAVAVLIGKYDLVVIDGGSLIESPAGELIASVSDITLADVRRGDRSSRTARALEHLAQRPRHAAGIVFSNALRRDPGLET